MVKKMKKLLILVPIILGCCIGCCGGNNLNPPQIETVPVKEIYFSYERYKDNYILIKISNISSIKEIRIRQKGENYWFYIFYDPPANIEVTFPIDQNKEKIIEVYIDGKIKEYRIEI